MLIKLNFKAATFESKVTVVLSYGPITKMIASYNETSIWDTIKMKVLFP